VPRLCGAGMAAVRTRLTASDNSPWHCSRSGPTRLSTTSMPGCRALSPPRAEFPHRRSRGPATTGRRGWRWTESCVRPAWPLGTPGGAGEHEPTVAAVRALSGISPTTRAERLGRPARTAVDESALCTATAFRMRACSPAGPHPMCHRCRPTAGPFSDRHGSRRSRTTPFAITRHDRPGVARVVGMVHMIARRGGPSLTPTSNSTARRLDGSTARRLEDHTPMSGARATRHREPVARP
jgi:hypothetical protein